MCASLDVLKLELWGEDLKIDMESWIKREEQELNKPSPPKRGDWEKRGLYRPAIKSQASRQFILSRLNRRTCCLAGLENPRDAMFSST